MSEKHTQGRLVAYKYEDGKLFISNGHLQVASVTTAASMDCSIKQDEAEANTRRFVACWNACDGIATEILEAGKIVTIAAHMAQNVSDKRRDKFLEALKVISEGRYVEGEEREIASAAIDEATNQQQDKGE